MDFLSMAKLISSIQNKINKALLCRPIKSPTFKVLSHKTNLVKVVYKKASLRKVVLDQLIPTYQTERVTPPHFGDLVGIVGQQVSFLKIQNKNAIIRVGKKGQINSIGAIRKNSLDSLLVCFDQSGCQFDLQQIFLAQQRLIFVLQTEAALKTILKKLQAIITQLFTDQPLSQSCSNLCIEISKYQNRYFVQFKDATYFCEYFENELRKINIQLSNKEQYQALIKKIKLKDFLDARLGKPSVKAKILNIQKEIKLQLQKARKKQQELRMMKLLYANLSESEQQEVIAKPKRKNSSFEAEIEAEYFKIRASEKKTGETEIQEQIDTTDLFYLIQERDSSCNQDKSDQEPLRVIPKNSPYKDKPRQRSKSEHCKEVTRSQTLDDQFFSRQ